MEVKEKTYCIYHLQNHSSNKSVSRLKYRKRTRGGRENGRRMVGSRMNEVEKEIERRVKESRGKKMYGRKVNA